MKKPSERCSGFSLSCPSRCRWNVLDLIQLCNRGSVATYMGCDIDMSWVENYRAELRKKGLRVTVTAILIKAIGVAQLNHPGSRIVMLPWGRTATIHDVVAGFTVQKVIDGESIVYFGTIKDPHLKPIEQIAQELRDYAQGEVAEIPQLEVEHRFSMMPWLFRRFMIWLAQHFPQARLRYLGGTFGLTSLGKFGIKTVFPPCVCTTTFGVGSVEKRPVVRGDQIVIRPMMSMIYNFDHRAIDGVPAANFFNDIRFLLEGGLAKHLGNRDESASQKAAQGCLSKIHHLSA